MAEVPSTKEEVVDSNLKDEFSSKYKTYELYIYIWWVLYPFYNDNYNSYLNNPKSFPSTISKSKRPFGLAGSSPSSAVMVKMAPSEMASWNSVIIAEHPRFGVSFPDILDLNSLSLLVNTGVWSFTSVTLTTNWANVWRELPVVKPKNISRIQSLSGISHRN